jgi:hypothetical protein
MEVGAIGVMDRARGTSAELLPLELPSVCVLLAVLCRTSHVRQATHFPSLDGHAWSVTQIAGDPHSPCSTQWVVNVLSAHAPPAGQSAFGVNSSCGQTLEFAESEIPDKCECARLEILPDKANRCLLRLPATAAHGRQASPLRVGCRRPGSDGNRVADRPVPGL